MANKLNANGNNKLITNPMGKPIRGRNGDTSAPTVPTGLVASSITQTTFTLSWNASTDTSSITYLVFKNGVQTNSTASTSVNITGLTPGVTYSYTVKARDTSGNTSAASTALSVTTVAVVTPTPDSTAPTPPPTNLIASSITGTTLTLSWLAASDNVGVTGYNVYKNGSIIGTTNLLTFNVTGLVSANSYNFTVKAFDAAGNVSLPSNTLSVTTPDTIPPSAPVLSYTNVTDTSLDLSWTPSSDNVGIVSYTVYKDEISQAVLGPSVLTYPVSGLVPETSYAFMIEAKDAANNATSSNIALVTTNPVLVDGAAFLRFSFTLTEDSTVSAGLYNGVKLIRTLISNRKYVAGTHIEEIAAIDETGNPIASVVGLNVKVISNNVVDTWEGVLANTSAEKGGPTIHNGFLSFFFIAAHGPKVYYCQLYAEGPPSQHIFDVADPQHCRTLFPTEKDGTAQATVCVATDGNLVYWAGGDEFSNSRGMGYNNFVFATKVSDDKEFVFANGAPYQCVIGRKYISTIDMSHTKSWYSGIAVQKTGNFLFTSRKDDNLINVVNKTTGALIYANTITAPQGLTCDESGNLWVIAENVVRKYVVSPLGVLTYSGVQLSGLVRPLALSLTPDFSTIAIADGGTSQQVKAFNAVTTAPTWTLGQAGGYYVDATVANDKFFFNGDIVAPRYATSISFNTDGHLWVLDGGNYRVIHFDASRNYVEQIQAVAGSYHAWADQTDPTRVFSEYMEFKVDYSKPLAPNDGSWTFVKNWGATITDTMHNKFVTIRPVKLSNGRTYTLISVTSGGYFDVYELTADNKFRYTGVRQMAPTYAYQDIHNLFLKPDGLYMMQKKTVQSTAPCTYRKRPLTGFDASGNPIFGADVVVENIAVSDVNDPMWTGNSYNLRAGQFTSTGGLVVFDGNSQFENYHLGVIKNNEFIWRASRGTFRNYSGEFPNDGAFDVGNGVSYSGNVAVTIGPYILWGYHGEFWKGGPVTNKYNLYDDSGLLIKQFGVLGRDYEIMITKSAPKMAGNVFAVSMVTVNGKLYIYHNDEGQHSGVHKWELSNLSSIVRTNVPVELVNIAPDPNVVDLMGPLTRYTKQGASINGWVRNPSVDVPKSSTGWWELWSGIKTYDRLRNYDLWAAFYRSTAGSATLSKDLGVNDLASWGLSGDINFEGNTTNWDLSNFTETGIRGQFLEILDDAGKILFRFALRREMYLGVQVGAIYANNVLVGRGNELYLLRTYYEYFKHFDVRVVGSTMTFKYADFPEITIPKYDATASINKPTTVRFYFWENTQFLNQIVAFRDFTFYKSLS
jgi:chitodextrinase